MGSISMTGIYSAEKGLLPDFLIRLGIRRLLKQRLKNLPNEEYLPKYRELFINKLKTQAIAVETKTVNEQHYELPAKFFEFVLGKNLKYSSALYPDDNVDLNQAEEHMLELTSKRAQVEDGMSILDLGCGWGSLSLWLASNFPNSKIDAVSNSHLQKEYIEKRELISALL